MFPLRRSGHAFLGSSCIWCHPFWSFTSIKKINMSASRLGCQDVDSSIIATQGTLRDTNQAVAPHHRGRAAMVSSNIPQFNPTTATLHRTMSSSCAKPPSHNCLSPLGMRKIGPTMTPPPPCAPWLWTPRSTWIVVACPLPPPIATAQPRRHAWSSRSRGTCFSSRVKCGIAGDVAPRSATTPSWNPSCCCNEHASSL